MRYSKNIIMPMAYIVVFSLSLMIALPVWAKDINSDLLSAVKKGRTEIVEALLAKGADVNTKDNSGKTALMSAVFNGYKEIVRFLLNKGAGVNEKNNEGMTALMFAAKKGHTSIPTVQNLLDKMLAKDKGNLTALLPATQSGYEDIVKILLNKGAAVNEKNNNGWTALMWAEFENNTEIVALLKRAGAAK